MPRAGHNKKWPSLFIFCFPTLPFASYCCDESTPRLLELFRDAQYRTILASTMMPECSLLVGNCWAVVH